MLTQISVIVGYSYCCCLWIETKVLSNAHETQCDLVYLSLSIRRLLALSLSSVDSNQAHLSQGFGVVHAFVHA